MIALVDATTFYSSCEKVFDPSIRKKPVVVLTNNDSCVCACCPISKKAGIKKFVPYFQAKEKLDKIGAVIFSSNYALYADLSLKMMDICGHLAPDIHIYSIDECFMFYPNNNYTHQHWDAMARSIRLKIWKDVRLPTGVGFGETATLAKAASHAAKRIDGFRGIAVINDEKSRHYVLSRMNVTDVWGIGSKIGKKLELMGIHTALDLANQTPAKMRKYFSILVENTVRELNGELRLNWDEVRSPKKEIFSSRSFGQRITEYEQIKFALAKHAGTVSEKLRRQKSLTNGMIVFAQSSPHDHEPFYRKSLYIPFAVPTQDTRIITAATEQALSVLYKPNIRFYKCGVGLVDIQSCESYQEDMFTPSQDNPALMECIDKINARFGRGTSKMAATGNTSKFAMRREFLSPQYTTNWKHIPKIKCK
jgi:DNA polymerase V